MYGKKLYKVAFVVGTLALAGCTSKIVQPTMYSGYLKDYSGLQEVTAPSGDPELRWVSPDFNPDNYDSIVYNQIVYYPEPKMDSQLGKMALDNILKYTNTRVKGALAERKPIVSKPGQHSLIFRGAITGVDISKEGLQFYEVIPAALLIAGVENLTGHRTADTNLYFEAELIDAETNKPVFKAVRKGSGMTVPNQSTPVTKNTLKKVIDKMALDIVKIKFDKKQ